MQQKKNKTKITDVLKTVFFFLMFVDDYVSSVLGRRTAKCADHRDVG